MKIKKILNYINLFVAFILIFGLVLACGEVSTKPEKVEELTEEDTEADIEEKYISEIEIAGKIIRIGFSADDIFQIVTDKYKIDSPTVGEGKVTHHYLDGKTLFDMTFERDKTNSYWVLAEIIIKDRNYQIPDIKEQPPVQYEIGHTSGFLAVISVPKGTTKSQLKELLSYFHSLKEKGNLSKVMKGHTVIDIFDDKKWTIKENYNNIILSTETYCNYIKATYSVDLHGVERASIGLSECPNYEEIKF